MIYPWNHLSKKSLNIFEAEKGKLMKALRFIDLAFVPSSGIREMIKLKKEGSLDFYNVIGHSLYEGVKLSVYYHMYNNFS
ncbi:MAG: hypothetical protein ABIA78_04035 [archaeon]